MPVNDGREPAQTLGAMTASVGSVEKNMALNVEKLRRPRRGEVEMDEAVRGPINGQGPAEHSASLSLQGVFGCHLDLGDK